jgi:hypothetical protein
MRTDPVRHDDDIDGHNHLGDLGDFGELDRILSSEEPLTPSSGFAAAVMERVHEAAIEPPPLPFPWTRFAAGVIACGVCAASGAALIVNTDWSALSATLGITELLRTDAPELRYAAAALLASFAVLRLHRRPPTSSR